DATSKQPLAGVTVSGPSADNRTVAASTTAIGGNYALAGTTPLNRLNFSPTRSNSAVVRITSRTRSNMVLGTRDSQIEEVVITGVGGTQPNTGLLNISARDLTTATATINASVLQDMQSSSIDEALQGRLPGVDIAANSGDPGSGMQIRI